MQFYSATKVLSPYFNPGGKIPQYRLEEAIPRGNEVHRFSTETAKGEWYPKPVLYEGYCDSFLWWFERCVAEVFLVEKELVDGTLGFLGHPDLLVRLVWNKRPSIVDLKTPATKQKAWRMQIAAYTHLAMVNGYPDLDPGGSLRLQADGRSPRFDEYQHKHMDFAAFLSALNVYRFLND